MYICVFACTYFGQKTHESSNPHQIDSLSTPTSNQTNFARISSLFDLFLIHFYLNCVNRHDFLRQPVSITHKANPSLISLSKYRSLLQKSPIKEMIIWTPPWIWLIWSLSNLRQLASSSMSPHFQRLSRTNPTTCWISLESDRCHSCDLYLIRAKWHLVARRLRSNNHRTRIHSPTNLSLI